MSAITQINLQATLSGHTLAVTGLTNSNAPHEMPTASVDVDNLIVSWTADDIWDNCTAMYATFWHRDTEVYRAAMTISSHSASVYIPRAVLEETGIMQAAIYGEFEISSEAKIVSSNAVKIRTIQGAMTEETAPEPSESMFEQAVVAGVQAAVEQEQSASAQAANTAAETANTAAEAANAAAASAISASGGVMQLYYPTGDGFSSYTKGSAIGTSSANGGKSVANNKRTRSTSLLARSGQTASRLAVSLDLEGYSYQLALYDLTGNLTTGAGFLGYQAGGWCTGKTIIDPAAAYFVIVFRHVVAGVEQTMTDADTEAIKGALVIYSTTDRELTAPFVPADAKATGDRFATLEDASLLWTAFSPNMSRGRIKDDGSTDPYTARCHTAYLYHGKADSGIKRYKIRFESDTYAMRIAMYGANGAYDGTDFIGYLNSSSDTVGLASGTGTFELPENCKNFGLDFRKAGSESALTTADYDAIRAGLSVYTNTDTTLSLAGCAADAKAVRGFIAPELTASQKQDILDLVDAYYSIRENVVYRFVTTRNSFASKETTFDENNKLQLCCTAFTQLIWAGIDPRTFAEPAIYDGTIAKAFDWGYFLSFLIRQRTDGLAIRENGVVTGEYGYRSTNGYEHGWSFNSRYDAEGTWPNSQKPRTAMNASDIACELFNNGYEIPLRYADVGDMVFYEEIPSGMNEYYSNAFRRIDHGSIVIGKRDGFLEVAEVTSINGGNPPVLKRSIFSEDDFLAAKSGYMASRIVMVARHPAAFGVAGNVPNKFTTVNGRY